MSELQPIDVRSSDTYSLPSSLARQIDCGFCIAPELAYDSVPYRINYPSPQHRSQMSTRNQLHYIDHYAHLTDFCSLLEHANWIGIDTEFMRERTYFPEFCLLQISIEGHIACIDPLALPSLAPLKSILTEQQAPKLLHSGRQDLELFHLLWGALPVNVFDTQTAFSFSRGLDQIGYSRLVETLFGARLPKEQTRTNWSHRPLSLEQLSYAADDVAYLGPAYGILLDELEQMDRYAWFCEDIADLLDPSLYENLPESAWKRVGGISYLPPTSHCAAKALATWRETKAKELNLPRGWIFKDDILCQLALLNKPNDATLPPIRGIAPRHHLQFTQEVKQLLADAPRHVDEEHQDVNPIHLELENKLLKKRLVKIVQSKAVELNLPPSTLASRRDLDLLLENPSTSRVMKGWRRQAVGACLEELLSSSTLAPH